MCQARFQKGEVSLERRRERGTELLHSRQNAGPELRLRGRHHGSTSRREFKMAFPPVFTRAGRHQSLLEELADAARHARLRGSDRLGKLPHGHSSLGEGIGEREMSELDRDVELHQDSRRPALKALCKALQP
jgi:hypothetical protein